MDDGKEDVNILDLTASEVNYNFIGLFDQNQLQKEINRKFGKYVYRRCLGQGHKEQLDEHLY